MTYLNSSAIRAVDYDPESRRMNIRFTSGGTYTFYRVPEAVYLGLITSSSPGSYYNYHIRGLYR